MSRSISKKKNSLIYISDEDKSSIESCIDIFYDKSNLLADENNIELNS